MDGLSKMERPKPSLHLNKKDLPESESWETGKKYKVTATLKKIGHHEDMFGGKDKNISSSFEVHDLQGADDKDPDEDEKPGKGEGSQDKN